MQTIDLSGNHRLRTLSRLSEALQASQSPMETLRIVRECFAEAYGHTPSLLLATRGLPEGQYRVYSMDLTAPATTNAIEPEEVARLPIYEGGVIGEVISEGQARLLQDVDWTDDPGLGQTLAGYNSILAVPLAGRSLPMTWVVLLKPAPGVFTPEELEHLVVRASLVSSLVESQSLAEDLCRANQRVEDEMRQVGQLQRSLLPQPLPEVPGLEIAASYEPSGRAGGDLYDIFPILGAGGPAPPDRPAPPAPERWCILVADASGHGVAAAVVIAMTQSLLRAHPDEVAGPADLLAYANRHLCRRNIGGFVTAFLAVYEPGTRRLAYAAAGHPPPFIKNGAGRVSTLSPGTPDGFSYPIGIDPGEVFQESAVRLEPGDALLLYTDGITEAHAPDGTMLEADRVEHEFRGSTGEPGHVVRRMRMMVSDHQRDRPQVDDQTLLALRVR